MCLILKKDVRKIGQVFSVRRAISGRVDTDRRCRLIKTARTWIYSHGYSIASDAVEKIPGQQSLVPTRVGSDTFLQVAFTD